MSPSIFEEAEAWETSTLYPVGTHTGKIVNPSIDLNRNGNPEITLRVENSIYNIGGWIPYSKKALGKVAQVFDAAGVERPHDGEFDPTSLRLTDACIERLNGRQVGIVVRDEVSNKDPSKTFRTIVGFISSAQVTDDMPADMPAATKKYADDDIPF